MMNPKVVVAGLGAMGSSALYHLARRGTRVVGLDRFQPPHAMGSSHGDSRIIREAYYEHPLYVPLVRRAYELWDELARNWGKQVYRKTGGLMLGPPDGPLLTGCLASVREHGIPHKMLSATEVGNRWRGLTPPEGFVGLWEERAGMLFPERVVAAHLRLAAEAGAEVRTNTTLLGWSRSGEDLVLTTDRGDIRTRYLVLALGPWISQLLPSQARDFAVERQQFHWFDPASGYGDLGPDQYPVALWEHWPGGLFVTLPDAGNGVKIDIHHEGESADPDTVSRVTTPEEEAAVRVLLAKFFPGANGRLRASTVCLYTNTPDRHFVIDWHSADPGVLVLSPCSGHGFKFSSVVGEVAADLVLSGRSRFDLTPFSLTRF
ncbi:MAG TPA: N-methyl-L-tryptophan oxidase [Gemmatimonadales bacterium]|nr:N-methyl-L-tryptophan oxidase [Gemmatimonadales bacterium]